MGDVKTRNTYPKVIGETGGKNFHFVDESCQNSINEVVNFTIESAFNYWVRNVVLVLLSMSLKKC